MNLKKLFQELKRRNVYKVAITYGIVAWLSAQIASVACGAFEAPSWVMKIIIVLLVIGFPIALILAWAFEMSPQGIIRTASLEAEENPYSDNRKKPFTNNMIIGILLVVIIGQFIYNKSRNNDSVVNQNIEKSIAVLPFKNMSENKENQHFCDGIMEALLNHLSKFEAFNVVSRTSVEQYRDNPEKVSSIGKKLNVNYILEGSVQRIEDQALITAQLIYAPTDHHIWGESYKRNLSDIFNVQADVTKILAEKLHTSISPELVERIETEYSTNFSAYDHYLKGKELYSEFWQSDNDFSILKKMRSELITAINIDRNFAPAYSLLATIYGTQHWFLSTLDEHQLDTMRQFAEKALALDSTLDNAYYSRGLYHRVVGNIDAAFNDFSKLVELNPNHDQGYFELASLHYFNRGDLVESYRLIDKNLKINVYNSALANSYRLMAYIYNSLRQIEKSDSLLQYAKSLHENLDLDMGEFFNRFAKEDYQSALKLITNRKEPLYSVEAYIYRLAGKYQEVLQLYEKEKVNYIDVGVSLIEMGQREDGEQLLQDVLKANDQIIKDKSQPHSELRENFKISAYLRQHTQAMDYLNQIDLYIHQSYVWIDPMLDSISDYPPFVAFLQEQDKRIAQALVEINKLEAL